MKNVSKDVLKQLIPGVFVIPGMTNIGVISFFNESTDTTDVYLVDTGNSSYYGSWILKSLNNHFEALNQKYKIQAIINTHSHSDHIGGNALIQKETGCQIWMSSFESNLSEISLVHSAIIYGGNTVDEIKNHASIDETLKTDRIITGNEIMNLGKLTVSFILLPGHAFNDLGIVCTSETGEKVLFAGDSIFTCSDPEKHPIHFMIHPVSFMKSLETIKSIKNLKYCIPGHGEIITENIEEKIDYCIKTENQLRDDILFLIREKPCSTEKILQIITKKYNIRMGFVLYHLLSCTIKAFLGDLKNEKLIYPEIEDNELLWSIKK